MSQKNKTTSLKNILGFSLVELMVTLGIAGAGTLGFMQLQKSQITGQKKTESKYDATSIANSIGTLLLSKEACRATFTGRTFSETPTSLTRIRKYSANNTAVDAYVASSSSPLQLGNINVVGFEYALNGPLVDSGSLNKYGSFTLAVLYQNQSSLLDNRTFRIEVPYAINVETDTANRFLSCYTEVTDIETQVAMEACGSIGGLYQTATGKCDLLKDYNVLSTGGNVLTAHPTLSAQNNSHLLNYAYFRDQIYPQMFKNMFIYSMKDTNYDDAWGTVTGNIQMSNSAKVEVRGPMSSDNAVISKEYADNFFDSCGSNEVGIFTSSGIKCVNLLCPPKAEGGSSVPQYLAGIDQNGEKLCHPIVSQGDICPVGGELKIVGGKLTYDCCVPNCNDAINQCSGTVFESSNSCGNCVGKKAPEDATWGAWKKTGVTRTKAGATCTKECGGGSIATEYEEIKTCNNDAVCGGNTCTGTSQRWVTGSAKACNTQACPCVPTKTCAQLKAETCSGQPAGVDSCGNSCGTGNKSCAPEPYNTCLELHCPAGYSSLILFEDSSKISEYCGQSGSGGSCTAALRNDTGASSSTCGFRKRNGEYGSPYSFCAKSFSGMGFISCYTNGVSYKLRTYYGSCFNPSDFE